MKGYARFVSLMFLCCAGCAAPRPSPILSEGPERPARIHTDLKIGIALGGSGANGLAHINMLEVFDELEITPHRIAGTSIGAINVEKAHNILSRARNTVNPRRNS